MIYQGSFNTYDNESIYNVKIGNVGATYAIQDPSDPGFYSDGTRLVFSTDPVTITADRQDLMKRIIISQCTIKLVGNDNMTDTFFADTNRSIPVTITKQLGSQPAQNDPVVFFGYVDPLQFDQGYAEHWEDIEITATDPLGALEDYTIDQVTGIDATSIISPKAALDAILSKLGISLDYEHSVYVNASVLSSFSNTRINMQQFFGDDQDDRDTLYDVLEQVLKYFNMYLTMKGDKPILTSTINQTLSNVSVNNLNDYVTDSGTSISTDDAYSRVTLTCDIEPIKDFISMGDDDDFYSLYNNMERYMTEYVCPGEGERAHKAFTSLVMTGSCDYDNSYAIEHYCYLLGNHNFNFGDNGYDKQPFFNPANGHDQREALYWLAELPNPHSAKRIRAGFVGFGKGNKITNGVSDNSPQSTMSLEKWLVISTLGTNDNNPSQLNTIINNYKTALESLKANPICTYTKTQASILSPTTSDVTNYLIISCNILLNPNQPQTGYGDASETSRLYNTYETLYSYGYGLASTYWHHTVPNPDNGDGAYYTQKWDWKPQGFDPVSSPYINHGIFGFLDNQKNQSFSYDYSKVDGNLSTNDTISKIPLIACELKVIIDPDDDSKTKYCVERLDKGPTGVGKFEWLTINDCPLDSDGDRLTYFTIGIDPKIGDNIIGQSFKIQNNISYKLGLDTSGTGIPIKQSDELSGTISFKIIGPYNAVWDENTKHTHTKWLFWKCTHENSNTKSILNNVQSIMIKDLKIDVKSDNGGRSQYTTADNDLVYYSNVNYTYLEKLEEDISLVTGRYDIQNLGIRYEVSNSYVANPVGSPQIDPVTGATYSNFQGWWDSTNSKWIKPEECYVDYLYQEYNHPAKMISIQLSTDFLNNSKLGNNISYDMLKSYMNGVYPDKYLGNNRYEPVPCTIMSYTTNLKNKRIDLNMRETKTITNTQISN